MRCSTCQHDNPDGAPFCAECGSRLQIATPVQMVAGPTGTLPQATVLQERIRQRMATADQKQIYLRGDGTITYQQLVGVMDMLKAAGVEQIGLETDVPPRSAR